MSAVANEVVDASPEWTDARGVADYLGGAVPTSTISTLARAGRIPSVKIGARRIFHLPTVSDLLMDAMSKHHTL